jgi:flagellar basal body rod protein FlgG
MTSLYAHDVYANNLANMDTPGFKPEIPSIMPRLAVRQEDHLPFMPSNALLERLGGGALRNPNRGDFTQGSLKETNGPLDVAIEGEGFFVVKDPSEKKSDRVRLTRDGRMTRDSTGRLVMAASGLPVMDVQDKPITLGPGTVSISGDGTVCAGGRECGHIKVVEVDDKSALTRLGQSLFLADKGDISTTRPTGAVHQFSIEDSAADEIKMYLRMTAAARDVETNVTMIQQHDRMMDRAVGLGRVA